MSVSVTVRTLALALAALLAAAPAAGAATIHVPADHASLEDAYRAAQAGDTIELAAGVHGPQRVPAGLKALTVHGAPGNKVRQLVNSADNITFDGLDIDAGMTKPNGAAFEANAEPGGQNVTFKNGRIGNVVDQKGAVLGGTTNGSPLNLVIDNVEFHDVVQATDGVHNECVFSQAAGLTIRNSTFTNCATMDLFVLRGDWWGQQPYGSITLENNVFGHSVNGSGWHYYGLYWTNGAFEDVRVVNNTFENSVILGNPGAGPYSGVWANNIGGGWSCLAGVTYRGNVGTKCHASDTALNVVSSCAPPACNPARTMPVGWANPAANDFRLTAGSAAIDAGDPAFAPARDRDCRARDARPDAGAFEFGAGAASCAGGPSAPVDPADPASPGADAPGGTAATALTLRSAKLGRSVVCRRARRGCPAATTLRVSLTHAGRVSVRVTRAGRTARKLSSTRASVRITARGLRAGRYKVRVAVAGGTGSRVLSLRVRA